jgi:drug/metabolite transporter superfamily protein YnfA
MRHSTRASWLALASISLDVTGILLREETGDTYGQRRSITTQRVSREKDLTPATTCYVRVTIWQSAPCYMFSRWIRWAKRQQFALTQEGLTQLIAYAIDVNFDLRVRHGRKRQRDNRPKMVYSNS